MFLAVLTFNPNWGFYMGYSLCMVGDFQNGCISQILGAFASGFFAQNNSTWFVEWVLTCFFGILLFDPKWGFCMGYSLCMMADFQNGLISRIFKGFFERFRAQNNSKWFVEWILTCSLEFYFLTQSEDFAWAIAFAWWPIFRMAAFLEYLVFSSGFLHRTTLHYL